MYTKYLYVFYIRWMENDFHWCMPNTFFVLKQAFKIPTNAHDMLYIQNYFPIWKLNVKKFNELSIEIYSNIFDVINMNRKTFSCLILHHKQIFRMSCAIILNAIMKVLKDSFFIIMKCLYSRSKSFEIVKYIKKSYKNLL